MDHRTLELISTKSLAEIYIKYPYTEDFFMGLRLNQMDQNLTLLQALEAIPEKYLEDFSMDRESLIHYICEFMEEVDYLHNGTDIDIHKLTILGGQNKLGEIEEIQIEIEPGQVISVVGPTGSGKSRLLADIECLAQADTPTGRKILLNGQEPDDTIRFSPENRLVAQLSQNMNFVMDLSVEEFVRLHAESRISEDLNPIVSAVIDCANGLSGEKFSRETSLTQLSGGQSRALMIADTALISTSPIVLIDEIENAGIDRQRALELLVQQDKIVFVSTHDPILALNADKRIVIQNGGIQRVISTGIKEYENLKRLSMIDEKMSSIRNLIRSGQYIDFDISSFFLEK